MKAVLFQRGGIELTEVPNPTVGDDQVLIRVGSSGICASDLHAAAIKDFELPYPFVPGHEFAGAVAAVGPDVSHLRPGEHAVVQPLIPCRICGFCQAGRINMCRNAQLIGLHLPGGCAEYVAVPGANAVPGGELPDPAAACTEPLACALHGLERARLSPGDQVLIFGAGAIGLFFLQLARLHGAGRIAVVDLHPHRLELARRLGADEVVLAARASDANGPAAGEAADQRSAAGVTGAGGRAPDDASPEATAAGGGASAGALLQAAGAAGDAPVGAPPEATGDRGRLGEFDCVVDATGVPAVVEAALEHLGPGGTLLLLGSCPLAGEISMRPRLVQSRDASVVGSFGFTFEFSTALRLLQQGRITVDGIAGPSYPLEACQQAFAEAGSGTGGVKVQFTPR